jgi:hypothetical protein
MTPAIILEQAQKLQLLHPLPVVAPYIFHGAADTTWTIPCSSHVLIPVNVHTLSLLCHVYVKLKYCDL